jgi:MFS family permease
LPPPIKGSIPLPAERSFPAAYLPVLCAIAAAYLVTGSALSALPLFLHRDMGFGVGIVGAAAGLQFLCILLARLVSGRMCDRLGPKRVIIAGLVLTAFAGIAYLLSLAFSTPALLLAAIFAGRALSGVGEAFVITSGQMSGIALMGRDKSAAAIGWAGTSLFLGLAVGGPLGGITYEAGGFGTVAMMSIVLPLLCILPILSLPEIRPAPTRRAEFRTVFSAVIGPGLAMCLAGFAFSGLAFFSVLLAVDRDWQPNWGIFTAFSLGLVFMRVGFGTVPDRLGGMRTALWSFAALIVALSALVLAPSHAMGLLAGFLCGASYSFIYPALGRVAVRTMPAAHAGSALALYSAFNDVSLAVSNPLLGLVAERAGIGAVFVVAAIGAAGGLILTATLLLRAQGAK